MKLFDFLTSSYMKDNEKLSNASHGTYSAYIHAKSLAADDLRSFQRKLLKVFAYFHVLGHFLLIKLHLTRPLESAEDIIKRMQGLNGSKQ